MLCRPSSYWVWRSVFSVVLIAWSSATAVTGQETAAVEAAEASASDEEQVDPYEVPEGDIEALVDYLQTGPQRMQPRTRDDAVRMFHSLDTAAERVFDAPEATPEQRLQAAGARVAMLSRLQMFGDTEVAEKLRGFLDRLANSDDPELQQFGKTTILSQKISSWQRLDPSQQEEVLAELRSRLTSPDVQGGDVIAVMKLADAVAETPSADRVVMLIEEVLPHLREVETEEVGNRLGDLEGLVRRLRLPGNPMDVEGTLLSGEPLDWQSYRGKVVLVDYWATWCGPCIAELPNVLAAYEAYHDKGFDVVGISLDEEKEAVRAFIEAQNIPWQTMFSDDATANGWNHPMATKYAINGIPRAILVDQQGKVVSMNLRGPALEKALAELLGPVEPATDEEASNESDDTKKTAAIE